MQFYTLAIWGRIFPLWHSPGHHGIGLQNHVIFKPVLDELSLNPKYTAHLYIFQNGLCLPGFQESCYPDRIGIVRHIELNNPGIALGQFLMLNGKDLSLYNDGTHVQVQIFHGRGISPERLSVEGVTVLNLRGLLLGLVALGHGNRGQGFLPDFLHGLAQLLVRKLMSRLHADGHIRCKPGFECRYNGRNLLFDSGFSVGYQGDGQFISVPRPFGPGQGASCHRVLFHKQAPKLLRLHLGKLLGRMGDHDMEFIQPVEFQQFFF